MQRGAAELYTAAERKIQYLSALHQCSRDIGPAPDLDRVLQLTTERMAQLLELKHTAVLFWSPDTEELWSAASYPPLEGISQFRMPVTALPAAAALLRGGEPMLSPDPAGEGLLSPDLVQALGLHTVLAAPLIAHDQVIGLLVGDRGEASANSSPLSLHPGLRDSVGRGSSRRDLLLTPDETELAMIFAHKAAALWITSARLFIQQHEARARAEAAETQFRGLLETAPHGIVCVDREGRMVLLNPQVESLFGYRREELLGQPIESSCRSASAPPIWATGPATVLILGPVRWEPVWTSWDGAGTAANSRSRSA
jgi:PAS domain-containing protein